MANIVDLTYTMDETTLHMPHRRGFEFNIVEKGITSQGYWLQSDEYSSGTHAGTHIDAPAHCKEGGITVDQIPLSSLIAPAAVVDITSKAESNPDAELTVQDLLQWESITKQSLNGKIILMRSGWGKKWNNLTEYLGSAELKRGTYHYPGFSREAAQFLVDSRSILGIGTEAISFDTGNSIGLPVHQIILGHGLYGIENIANMDQLPISGALLHVIPTKIGKASGAPARIYATFPHCDVLSPSVPQ